MDQIKTGGFIAAKRKEKGLTQRELADRLGISDKTVSKWECGKGMPELSLMQPLCRELGFSEDEMAEWRWTILGLLENPYIEDSLQRLGADSRRKLGAYDRLTGPARLCAKHGKPPVQLAKAIAGGYSYENDDPGTHAVRGFVRAHGFEAALAEFSDLHPGDGIYEYVRV